MSQNQKIIMSILLTCKATTWVKSARWWIKLQLEELTKC